MLKLKRDRKTTSYSELRTWTTCRKQWYWKYVLRITPKRVIKAPYFGTLGHMGLEMLYTNFTMNEIDYSLTGHVKANYIDSQKLFDEDIESFMKVKDDVMQVLRNYDEYYGVTGGREEFRVVETEYRFEIPLPRNPVRLMGYIDMIVEDTDNKLWIMEHKFPKAFKDPEWTDMDGQIGAYQYAVRRSGFPVVGTIYNQSVQKFPKIPKLNNNGAMSRANIYTTWETYKDELVAQGLDPAEYEGMKDKLNNKDFFRRHQIYRGETEIERFADDMNGKIFDMAHSCKHIYRTDNSMICNAMCSFKNLCSEELRGGDVEWIIDHDFEPKVSNRKKK
ncbi:MAG: PD-(D/E)XK nuclease family protein [Spirochaetales bacterium]|jgi:hypothetical protein|nr:PD-(D/E)XK nuclease family protein [Spirochaetales bacterium]